MLPVCEPGDGYNKVWGEYGFSRCFLQLVGPLAGAGVLYVLGLGAVVLGTSQLRIKVLCYVTLLYCIHRNTA